MGGARWDCSDRGHRSVGVGEPEPAQRGVIPRRAVHATASVLHYFTGRARSTDMRP